jgi:LAS superfamily LD-carboxypeptidase LdcB
MHVLAARGLVTMAAAAKEDIGIVLLGASGWRPHRWASLEQYEQVLVEKYGSVQRGRMYLAFDSPHETGLALDFECGGLEPRSATIPQQLLTPIHRWLVENAWKFGWHPYKVEPWHWEFPVSLDAYREGDMRPGDPGAPTPHPEGGLMCMEATFDEAQIGVPSTSVG